METSIEPRTDGAPAPGDLALVHAFLNTWSDELAIEDLATPAAAEVWLRRADLWEGRQRVSVEDHRRVLAFRQLLRECVLDKSRTDELYQNIGEVTFTLSSSQGKATLTPATGSTCDRALAKLTTFIYTSVLDGTWQRFKCCALPTCGWAYYDTSRSRTKRWCSMTTCGSRHKAREYYKRTRESGTETNE